MGTVLARVLVRVCARMQGCYMHPRALGSTESQHSSGIKLCICYRLACVWLACLAIPPSLCYGCVLFCIVHSLMHRTSTHSPVLLCVVCVSRCAHRMAVVLLNPSKPRMDPLLAVEEGRRRWLEGDIIKEWKE